MVVPPRVGAISPGAAHRFLPAGQAAEGAGREKFPNSRFLSNREFGNKGSLASARPLPAGAQWGPAGAGGCVVLSGSSPGDARQAWLAGMLGGAEQSEVSGMHGLLPVRPQGQMFQQLSGIHRGSNYILYMLYFCYKALLPPCLHHSQTGRPTAWWLIQPVLPPGHHHTRVYPPQELQAHRPSGSPWEHGAAGWHVLHRGRSLQALSDRVRQGPWYPHKACPYPASLQASPKHRTSTWDLSPLVSSRACLGGRGAGRPTRALGHPPPGQALRPGAGGESGTP